MRKIVDLVLIKVLIKVLLLLRPRYDVRLVLARGRFTFQGEVPTKAKFKIPKRRE